MIARPDIQDCVIIGGGPAGLTAALYLARFLRSVTVFEAQDGRARLIPKTHNLAPFPDGISGRDLLDRLQTHAELYGASIESFAVRKVEKLGGAFQVNDGQSVRDGAYGDLRNRRFQPSAAASR